MGKNTFITKFKNFILNEKVKIPENYNYDNIIIGIYDENDLDYILNYFYNILKFEKYNVDNTYSYINYIRYRSGVYFRITDNKYISFGPIDQLEEIADILNISYEKLFTIKDVKNDIIDNLLKYGKSESPHPTYKPRYIIRENILNVSDEFLLEKSSLTRLGVPDNVMKSIQKDFAIPSNSNWNRIRLKSDIKEILREGDKELFIQISLHSIKVFVTYIKNKEKLYFVDNYIFKESDWAGGYEKQPREYMSMTQLFYKIKTESLIYHLQDDFSLMKQSARKRKKAQIEFNEFTEQFKKDFLKNFESILKRLVGAKYNSAKKEIQEKARRVELENKMMLSGLSDPLSGPNSLTILDEFLIKFEEEYSEFFGEYLNIQELSEYFSRDKIMTSFMYFIYTGKILNK